jgi:hypothetical protein
MLSAPGLRAEGEALELILHAPSELGNWRFLPGAPLDLTVSLVNARARQAERAATQAWLERVREAERVDGPIPEHPGRVEASHLAIAVGEDNLAWFADVTLTTERLGPNGQPVLADLIWSDLRSEPAERREGEVLLEIDPIWTTLRIPPAVTQDLVPGRYRFTASKPGAATGSLEIVIQPPSTTHELGVLHHEQALHELRFGEPDQAIALAKLAISQLQQDAQVPQLIVGQAHAAKGELKPALAAFEAFLAAYEHEERWEEFPTAIRNHIEDLKTQIQEGR